MSAKIETEVKVQVWGYCDAPTEEIARQVLRGDTSLTGFPGNYALAIVHGADTYLAASTYGVQPLYYGSREGRLAYGPELNQVVRSLGAAGRWDVDAIAEFLQTDYVSGTSTLNTDVRRLDAGQVLLWRNGSLKEIRAAHRMHYERAGNLDNLSPRALAERARVNLVQEVERWTAGGRTVVALSGGYDSRTILSLAMCAGRRPDVLTIGPDHATDVKVAIQIARGLELDLTRVQLTPQDYIRNSQRISDISGGLSAAWHWHTYIYPAKAKLGSDTILLGGNGGEFANNGHQLDFGLVSLLADKALGDNASVRAALTAYWIRKTQRPFEQLELDECDPRLAERFRPDWIADRCWDFAGRYEGSVLERLDRWFLWERVRGFHGLTQALIGATCMPVQPFISAEWISAIRQLPRSWKQGLRWVRYAVARNYPELLRYPEVSKKGIIGDQIAERVSGLDLRIRAPRVTERMLPFADYDALFSDADLLAWIEEMRELEALFSPKVIKDIIAQQRRDRSRTRAIAYLVSLGSAMKGQSVRASAAQPAALGMP